MSSLRNVFLQSLNSNPSTCYSLFSSLPAFLTCCLSNDQRIDRQSSIEKKDTSASGTLHINKLKITLSKDSKRDMCQTQQTADSVTLQNQSYLRNIKDTTSRYEGMVVHVLELEEVDGEDNLMLEMKTVQSLEVSMSPSSTRMGSSSDSDLSELEDL